MPLDQINRAAELDAAIEIHCARHGLRIGLAPLGPRLQTERKLKAPGHITGIVLTRPAKPFSQISAN